MEKQHVTKPKPRNRQACLYDAVAGRLTTDGFLKPNTAPSTRDTTNSAQTVAKPDEALYRRHSAPERYQEVDEYAQHRNLRSEQRLPDSDLLKTIHAYAADYYARTTADAGKMDQRSLDETALIAIGILLEEAAVQCIGETGDLALIEPA